MTRDAITPPSAGQKKSIVQLVEQAGGGVFDELGLSKVDAQMILTRGGQFKKDLARVIGPVLRRFSIGPNIVVVPNMSAVELTALTERELRLTYLDPDYRAWDYYMSYDGQPVEGRGQKFETIIVPKTEIKPSGETVSFSYARDYLLEQGYIGHVGAFTQWRRQNPELMGYHASIPEDRACWRDSDSRLCVPYSYFDGGDRRLSCPWIGHDLADDESVVGFRVVS